MSAIKRTFFYIRKNNSVPFYHEAGNSNYAQQMQQHAFDVDPRLVFTPGVYSENIHYFTLYHPNIETFKEVTQQLYFNGALKQEFKNCMRWTKQHNIAFALSASKVGMPVPYRYCLEHYYNIKTSDKTFIDATVMQKQALSLYDLGVSLPELYFTVNFFDYEHNVKHVETRYVNTTKLFWGRLKHKANQLYPRFLDDKEQYNLQHNIVHFEEIVPVVESDQADTYVTNYVDQYLPDDLKNLKLPMFL